MGVHVAVYVHGRADYREVFDECNQLLGAGQDVRFRDDPAFSADCGLIWNVEDQGLDAILNVSYGHGGSALRLEPDECGEECGRDCDVHSDTPACWLEVGFETAIDPEEPNAAGNLLAQLVAGLSRWLDDKGIGWSWLHTTTGEVHQGLEGLNTIGKGRLQAWAFPRPWTASSARASRGEPSWPARFTKSANERPDPPQPRPGH